MRGTENANGWELNDLIRITESWQTSNVENAAMQTVALRIYVWQSECSVVVSNNSAWVCFLLYSCSVAPAYINVLKVWATVSLRLTYYRRSDSLQHHHAFSASATLQTFIVTAGSRGLRVIFIKSRQKRWSLQVNWHCHVHVREWFAKPQVAVILHQETPTNGKMLMHKHKQWPGEV